MNNELFNQLRRTAGLRQVDLAAMLGVTQGVVSRWCNAGRKDRLPPPKYAIAALLLYREAPQSVRERVMLALGSLNAAVSSERSATG